MLLAQAVPVATDCFAECVMGPAMLAQDSFALTDVWLITLALLGILLHLLSSHVNDASAQT